jgi:CSLREA domain-containing protein
MLRSLRHVRSATLAAVILASIVTAPAAATTFTVTTIADGHDGACDAQCSLRDAVIAANAAPDADTIVIPPGTYVLGGAGNEDLAASGDLDLRASVTITGAGADLTIIDGGGVDRIFDIVESATVVVSGLTLRNGRVPAGDTQGGGALLWNEAGTGKVLDLRLDGVVVTGNDAGSGEDGGGGIRIAQDKPTTSTVTIADSTISGNTMTDGDGGGLHLCCENLNVTISGSTISGNTAVDAPNAPPRNGEGGGIYHCCTDTTLAITDSTISDNTGPTQGGGVYTCCGEAANTLLSLERSTVSGNTSLGTGAFVGNGGGIEGEGKVRLLNTTVSGNRATHDGGGIDNEDVLVMRNVTIVGNQGGRGGGFFEDGLMTLLGNVLFDANVETPGTPKNCGIAVGTDPLVSLGGNLSSDATCPLAGTGDQAGIDPMLGPLANNGGPTRTHALAPNSPAVDAGSDAACEALDQRSFPRPADGDQDGTARCDIGAFERGSVIENCVNGVDDNGNGLVDCLDFDCAGHPTCAERCDNCIDDDGDGAVDRDDLDCQQRSDGAGVGIGDPARAKPIVQCAAALQKAGAKAASARLRTLQTCVGRLGTCVQKKPDDARCLAKAGAGCTKRLAALARTADKARTAAVARCDALTMDELRAASGLGFGSETTFCADRGVPTLATADDVARCVLADHDCVADRLVALETPRAPELFTLGGLTPAAVLACGVTTPTGTGEGLGTRGKAIDACQRTLQKAGAKLVVGATAALRGCAAQVLGCRQLKPADPACVAKAMVACPMARTKVDRLVTTLTATIAKRCDDPTVAIAELLGGTGAGFQSQTGLCKALGVPSLGDVGAITTCLVRQHECHAQQLLERELPRLDELLATGGIVFP